MKVELTLSELQLIKSYIPKSVHPSTQALRQKLNKIVMAAEIKEGAEFITED